MRAFPKTILREYRRSLSRFLAVFAIVALGCGFLTGLMATTPDMRLSMDAYYDDAHFYDINLLCDAGFTDADLDAVRERFEQYVDDLASSVEMYNPEAYAMCNDALIDSYETEIGGDVIHCAYLIISDNNSASAEMAKNTFSGLLQAN